MAHSQGCPRPLGLYAIGKVTWETVQHWAQPVTHAASVSREIVSANTLDSPGMCCADTRNPNWRERSASCLSNMRLHILVDVPLLMIEVVTELSDRTRTLWPDHSGAQRYAARTTAASSLMLMCSSERWGISSSQFTYTQSPRQKAPPPRLHASVNTWRVVEGSHILRVLVPSSSQKHHHWRSSMMPVSLRRVLWIGLLREDSTRYIDLIWVRPHGVTFAAQASFPAKLSSWRREALERWRNSLTVARISLTLSLSRDIMTYDMILRTRGVGF